MTADIERATVPAESQDEAETPRPRYAGEIPAEGPLDATEGVEAFLRALERGEPWYPALLDVIARWTAADELVGERVYHYLLSGEAFDWLLLAQRLIEAADLWLPDALPRVETEKLLFSGMAPGGEDELEFARAIGPQKHRAHLNYQYGVVVEEALLLAVEQELQKAGSMAGARTADIDAYERVYGKPLDELLTLYADENDIQIGDRVDLEDWRAFTYWCSKYRFRTAEPARVASDTRKSLALLSTMDRHRRRVTRKKPEPPPEEPIDIGRTHEPATRTPQTSMWERAKRARGQGTDEAE